MTNSILKRLLYLIVPITYIAGIVIICGKCDVITFMRVAFSLLAMAALYGFLFDKLGFKYRRTTGAYLLSICIVTLFGMVDYLLDIGSTLLKPIV